MVVSICCAGVVRATSVVAPSFSELVSEAQSIVRAKVTKVSAAWVDSPQGRVIKTYVTFSVERQLKGQTSPEFVLQLLGGEIDGQGMRIQGMPQFVEGEREILFVAGNGIRFCPLVGMAHGRYRILLDSLSAREYVARDDRSPLTSEADVQLPQERALAAIRPQSASAALAVAAFEEKILTQVSRRAIP
jgi:hypothetical protein